MMTLERSLQTVESGGDSVLPNFPRAVAIVASARLKSSKAVAACLEAFCRQW